MIPNFLQQSLEPPAGFSPKNITLSNQVIIKQPAIGILEVIPPKATGAMILSSGIHGNETAPIELVNALVTAIRHQQITPSFRILFIIAHPKAILSEQRFLDENLNRLFADKLLMNPLHNQEQLIAKTLQYYCANFYQSLASNIKPWHLDLHCAIRKSKHPTFAVIPVSAKAKAQQINAFCQHAKLDASLLSQSPSSTFSWWSGEYFNAIAATIELGRVSPLYHNNLTKLEPFFNAIIALICDKTFSSDRSAPFITYQVSRTLYKTDNSFAFSFDEDAANFTFFAQGKLIATEKGKPIYAKEKGEAVVFPNTKVKPGQRAALLVQCVDL